MSGYKNTVYKLTFPNNMVYIGVSTNVISRWYGKGEHYKNQEVKKAIDYYGWENIKKEVIVKISHNNENDIAIKAMERELIKAYDNRCYNVMCTEIHNKTQNHFGAKRFWTIEGVTKSAVEWCQEYKKSYAAVLKRIERHNLTPIQALTFPNVPKCYKNKAKEYWEKQGCL